jgi:hypothetical protein
MRHPTLILTAVALIASAPAFAGNLTFDGGQTAWHSTQCTKPMPPASVMGAKSDAESDQLNSMVSQHNAYVDAAQNYMNCISNEADRDQTMVNQAITTGAQKTISDTQDEVSRSSLPMRARQGN